MKYRQSGKAVTHPKRELRRMRAKGRALVSEAAAHARTDLQKAKAILSEATALRDQAADAENRMRAPQGGRRHGGGKRA